MSAETLSRIADETSARLAVASHGAEVQAIGIQTMTAIGADLAEALFTHFGAGTFTNAEINVAILKSLDGLQQSVVESFKAFGVTDGAFLDQCLEAAASGFLDRGETLFSLDVTGGSA